VTGEGEAVPAVVGREMSVRIKAVVDRFVKELKEALDADIQDRVMKEREMQSYIQEREREVAEREAAWKAELSRREVGDDLMLMIPFLCFPHHSKSAPVLSSLFFFLFSVFGLKTSQTTKRTRM
jgi:hypothetical protein